MQPRQPQGRTRFPRPGPASSSISLSAPAWSQAQGQPPTGGACRGGPGHLVVEAASPYKHTPGQGAEVGAPDPAEAGAPCPEVGAGTLGRAGRVEATSVSCKGSCGQKPGQHRAGPSRPWGSWRPERGRGQERPLRVHSCPSLPLAVPGDKVPPKRQRMSASPAARSSLGALGRSMGRSGEVARRKLGLPGALSPPCACCPPGTQRGGQRLRQGLWTMRRL